MTNTPLFSVIIPAYNCSDPIKRAIDSVLAQSIKKFEIIVVDDGSTDDTAQVVRAIGDQRIFLHSHDVNQGQIAAINTAFSKTRGTFIAFLDSDDTWLPGMLLAQLEEYNKDPETGCVYTHSDHMTIDYGRQTRLKHVRSHSGYIYKEVLTDGYLCTMSALGAKRSCFQQVYPIDNAFRYGCRDNEICFQLAKLFKFALIKSPLTLYHVDAKIRITKNPKIPHIFHICGILFLININETLLTIVDTHAL